MLLIILSNKTRRHVNRNRTFCFVSFSFRSRFDRDRINLDFYFVFSDLIPLLTYLNFFVIQIPSLTISPTVALIDSMVDQAFLEKKKKKVKMLAQRRSYSAHFR